MHGMGMIRKIAVALGLTVVIGAALTSSRDIVIPPDERSTIARAIWSMSVPPSAAARNSSRTPVAWGEIVVRSTRVSSLVSTAR